MWAAQLTYLYCSILFYRPCTSDNFLQAVLAGYWTYTDTGRISNQTKSGLFYQCYELKLHSYVFKGFDLNSTMLL